MEEGLHCWWAELPLAVAVNSMVEQGGRTDRDLHTGDEPNSQPAKGLWQYASHLLRWSGSDALSHYATVPAVDYGLAAQPAS